MHANDEKCNPEPDDVLAFVASSPVPVSEADVCRALEISRDRARGLIEQLAESGRIQRPEGRRYRWEVVG